MEPTSRRTSSSCPEIRSLSPKRASCPGASLLAGFLGLGVAVSAAAAEYRVRPEVQVEQYFDDNVLGADNRSGDRAEGRASPEISSWNTALSPSVALGRTSD